MLLQPKCGRHEPATESSGVDFWNSGVNQSLAGRTIPSSLQTLTFRTAFEQSLVTVILPSGLQTLNIGEDYSHGFHNLNLSCHLIVNVARHFEAQHGYAI